MISKEYISDGFETGALPLIILIAGSVTALVAALVSQYVFGLTPCVLCIYQRWPFAIVIFFGVIGLISGWRLVALLLCGLSLLVNMAIAFFHVGVEQKWWKGTDSCHLPDLSSVNTVEEYMALLDNASITPCDSVPWDFYGVSMAGMNVMLCFLMGMFAVLSAIYVVRKSNGF